MTLLNTLRDRITRLRANDSGYSLIMALGLIVLLGATFTIVLGAAGNQIIQSRMSTQTIENEQGNDAALQNALDYLNTELRDPAAVPVDEWLVKKKAGGNPIPTTEAAAQQFTQGNTTYKWWLVDNGDHAIVKTAATTMKRTTNREYRIVAKGVSSFRKGDSGAVYNVSPFGAWSDAIGLERIGSEDPRFTTSGTPGSVGVYGKNTVNGEQISPSGAYNIYDRRASVSATTKDTRTYPLTFDLNGKYAQPTSAACPVKTPAAQYHKGIWDVAPFGYFDGNDTRTVDTTAENVVECYLGAEFPEGKTLTVTGGGVYTVYVRDKTTVNRFAGAINTTGGSQVHFIFEGSRGIDDSGRDIVLGNTANEVQMNNVFIFAPESTCRSANTSKYAVISGSVVCKDFAESRGLKVNYVAPKASPGDGASYMVYVLDHRN